MKKKVLKYADDGNTVVRPYMELTPYPGIEGVYTSLDYESYGRKYYHLIFDLSGVYFSEGTHHDEILFGHSVAAQIPEAYSGYLAKIPTLPRPQAIHVELYKDLGLDVAPLMAAREAHRLKREREEQERREEQAREAEERKNRHTERLIEAHQQLKAGEKIDKDHFIELCKIYAVPLHIRTIGMLNACQSAYIGTDQVRYCARKGAANNFDKVFTAARELVKL